MAWSGDYLLCKCFKPRLLESTKIQEDFRNLCTQKLPELNSKWSSLMDPGLNTIPVSPEPARTYVQGAVLSNSSGLKTCFQRTSWRTAVDLSSSAEPTGAWALTLHLTGVFQVVGVSSLGRPRARAGDPCSALCTQSFLCAGDGVGVGPGPYAPGAHHPWGRQVPYSGTAHSTSLTRTQGTQGPEVTHRDTTDPGMLKGLRSNSEGDWEKTFLNSGHASKPVRPWDCHRNIHMNCMDVPWVT